MVKNTKPASDPPAIEVEGSWVDRWRKPKGTRAFILGFFTFALIVVISLFVYGTGGTRLVWAHLMYLPIILAAAGFRVWGGVIAALVGGFILGPYMPMNAPGGVPQTLSNWVFRIGIFVLVGSLSGFISKLLNQQIDQLNATKEQLERDISARKIAEEHIRKLNRVYAVLSAINSLMVRETNPQAMLEGACRIAVEKGGFRLAWIGLRKDLSEPILMAAQAGASPETLAALHAVFNNPDVGCAFTDQASLTGKHAVCNDIAHDPLAAPWRQLALDRGYFSLASLPLTASGKRTGTFNLYAGDAHFFDADEINLLLELAADISFACGIFQRESERRQLEEQLRQSQKMEAIGLLAGGVAHDFNNILTAVIAQSELVQSMKDLPEGVGKALERISSYSDRGTNLTRQLLLFSRKQTLQPTMVELNFLVTDLSEMLKRIIGAGYSLDLKLHPQDIFVQGDPGMLDQVLMNLVVNARDAMPEGGKIIIETGEKALAQEDAAAIPNGSPGHYVSLQVTDSGCGIPSENLQHIFEPFFTTKDPGKGTGLGLATAFGIVQQHKGMIDVKSEVGRGTSIQILLPFTNKDTHPS